MNLHIVCIEPATEDVAGCLNFKYESKLCFHSFLARKQIKEQIKTIFIFMLRS